MNKKVLLKDLVERGTHIRTQVNPKARISDEGVYPIGEFWDANTTVDVIVNGASAALDTLKETETKLGQVDQALANRYTKAEIDAKLDDMLGVDAQDIEALKTAIEDLDSETGLLTTLASKQDVLVSGTNIKTVNGVDLVGNGNINTVSYHTLGNWDNDSTTAAFCLDIVADETATAGMEYLGKVYFSDLPGSLMLGEVVVEIISNDVSNGKNIHLILTSANTAPYRWEYSYVKINGSYTTQGWIGYLPQITSSNKLSYSLISGTPSLSTVATSGSYNDLSSKPTIPSIWTGTQAEYDLLANANPSQIDEDTIYIIKQSQS